MKRLIAICLFGLFFAAVSADNPQRKFSPEKFQAELEQYITSEASLSPQEAAAFFPLYREMQKKQRFIFNQKRKLGTVKPVDEQECMRAIQKRDQLELELKSIQQTYHNKFLSIISASKLYDVINAEDRFHRQMLRGWNRGNWNYGRNRNVRPQRP
jgi:hypothetical protein